MPELLLSCQGEGHGARVRGAQVHGCGVPRRRVRDCGQPSFTRMLFPSTVCGSIAEHGSPIASTPWLELDPVDAGAHRKRRELEDRLIRSGQSTFSEWLGPRNSEKAAGIGCPDATNPPPHSPPPRHGPVLAS